MRISQRATVFVPCAISYGVVCLLLSTTAWAGGRPDNDVRSWFGELSGGWAFAQSDTSDFLDDDWGITGAALFWPPDWPAGIKLQLGTGKLDISSSALDAVNDAIAQDPNNDGTIDDGDVRFWEFAVNGVWGPGERSNGLYLTGGIGAYYMKGKLTNTALVYYPPFCDGWYWWWCVPGGVGPGSVVVADDSTTRFGWNAGLGYSFQAGNGQVFLEAKYLNIDMPSNDLRFIPITVGYRW